MTSTPLPLSARFALWFSAWSAGTTSLDDTRDAIVGEDAAHDVVGIPGSDGSTPLIVALGLLRSHRASGAGIALPVPGDLLGLAGPGDFNVDVVEAGEGVVLEGADLGLVPFRAGAGVVWTCHHAVSRRQVPDPSEADQLLRAALVRTSGELADLDVARWRPEVADELMALRRHADFVFPTAMAPRAVRLAALATRCRTIVELALEDDGGAISASEAEARRAALAPLDHAARRGLVAACSFPWDR
ncbi:MAG: hypothetical protein ABIQ59_10485 [Nocardioidaceae bacterium]